MRGEWAAGGGAKGARPLIFHHGCVGLLHAPLVHGVRGGGGCKGHRAPCSPPRACWSAACPSTPSRRCRRTWLLKTQSEQLWQPGGGAFASRSELGGPTAPPGNGEHARPEARRLSRPPWRAVAQQRRLLSPRCLGWRAVALLREPLSTGQFTRPWPPAKTTSPDLVSSKHRPRVAGTYAAGCQHWEHGSSMYMHTMHIHMYANCSSRRMGCVASM